MPITTLCPQCKSMFRLPEQLAGKHVRCQKCQQMFIVPLTCTGTEAIIALPASAAAEPAAPATVPSPPSGNVPPVPSAPPVLAELAIPKAEDVIVTATLVESAPPPEAPAPAVAPVPAATPIPPDRPVSVRQALIGVGGFFAIVLVIVGIASLWVSFHLAPPRAATPVLSLWLADNQVAFNDLKKDGKKEEGRRRNRQIVPLQLQPDGTATEHDRLEQIQPWMNQGMNQGWPSRSYTIRLEQGKRYNLLVTTAQFVPHVLVRFGNMEIAQRTGNGNVRRVFLSLQPNQTGEHLIQVSAMDFNPGNYTLQFALESVPEAMPIEFPAAGPFIGKHELRIVDPVDPAAGPNPGPYREYTIALEANQEYIFKVTGAELDPVLRIEANQRWMEIPAPPFTRTAEFRYRAPFTGPQRLRIASIGNIGMYTLSILHVDKPLHRTIVLLEDGQYQDGGVLTDADPREARVNGGYYKEYLVPLARGNTYAIDMVSKDFTTRLVILDPDGRNDLLAQRIDKNSRMVYECRQDGVYRIHVAAAIRNTRGAYRITITRL